MSDSIRIAIGYDKSTTIAAKVLEHSIRKNASENLDIQFFDLRQHFPAGMLAGKSGFSFLRWAIAEFFSYKGKAIYLDADQLVFGDILELWNSDKRFPNPDAAIWCAHQPRPMSSVMLIDCERMKGQLPPIAELKDYYSQPESKRERAKRYRGIMRLGLIKHAPQAIENEWNHLDFYEKGQTKLLHYTSLKAQPWRTTNHPLGSIWYEALVSAIEDDAVTWSEVEEAASTFVQLERGEIGNGLNPDVLEHLKIAKA